MELPLSVVIELQLVGINGDLGTSTVVYLVNAFHAVACQGNRPGPVEKSRFLKYLRFAFDCSATLISASTSDIIELAS